MEREIKRLINLLSTLDPTTEQYTRVVCNLDQLVRVNSWSISPELPDSVIVKSEYVDTGLTAEEVPQSTTVTVEEPIADNVILHSEEITSEMVRDALTQAAKEKIKIAPIMAKYVPEGAKAKYSNIPVANYPALMEELKALMEG